MLESRRLLATYYVSPSGSDAQGVTGTSPSRAWQTIAKVGRNTFAPGDVILLESGQTFAGNFYFTYGGTATSPITIGTYDPRNPGQGAAPPSVAAATIKPAGTKNGFYAESGGFRLTNLAFDGTRANDVYGVSFYSRQTGGGRLPSVTVENIKVTNFDVGVRVGSLNAVGFDDVTIDNVEANDNLHCGIQVWGPSLDPSTPTYAHTDVRVTSCKAYDNAGNPTITTRHTGSGIYLGSIDNGLVERCVAYRNGANNTADEGPVGIWTADSNRITIQHNESYENKSGSVTSFDGDGFDLDQNVTNSLVQYNYSHDNEGAGFLICAGRNAAGVPQPNSANVVRYNISQNDARARNYGAISTYGYVSDLQIYGNTVFISSTVGSLPPGVVANEPVALKLVGRNHRIFNNIFVTTGGVTLVKYETNNADRNPYQAATPNVDPNIRLQGNSYWSSGGAFRISWEQKTYGSLSSWLGVAATQERVGSTIVGRSVDPLLTSPGGAGTLGDASLLETGLDAYKLRASSPLINGGLNPSTVTAGLTPAARDFYGAALPGGGGFDVGANESTLGALTGITLTNPVAALAENTATAARIRVADISPTGDGRGATTISLSGTNADSFEVLGNALYLKAGVSLDYEATSSYGVTVSATTSLLAGGTPVTAAFKLGVTDVLDDYVIVAPAGASVTIPSLPAGCLARVVKRGAGELLLDRANTHTGGTLIEAGAARLTNTAALGTGRLEIAANASMTLDVGSGTVSLPALVMAATGRLEFGFGGIAIASGGYSRSAVEDLLRSGSGGGWTGGPGFITSHATAVASGGLGFVINDDGSASIRFATAGDVNLDGLIDILDASAILAAGIYNTSDAAAWWDGDCNYDGVLDILDISSLLASGLFNAGAYIPAPTTRVARAAPALSATEAAFMALFPDRASTA